MLKQELEFPTIQICNKCSISLSKNEIIQELMKQHPAHKHAVESIIERKQDLDNIKRDLLYNYNLRFTGTKKNKK